MHATYDFLGAWYGEKPGNQQIMEHEGWRLQLLFKRKGKSIRRTRAKTLFFINNLGRAFSEQ
jgi:hypothetical protein